MDKHYYKIKKLANIRMNYHLTIFDSYEMNLLLIFDLFIYIIPYINIFILIAHLFTFNLLDQISFQISISFHHL